MTWRKWIVKSLVVLVATSTCVAAWVCQHWTDPEVVRAQVLGKLGDYFPGAKVTLDAAHFSVFGGIALNELLMARKDDPDQSTFAHFSTGTIYLDKEKVGDGKPIIKKLEFPRPVLNILRRADGTWNLNRNILATPDPRVRVPMIVLQNGTLYVEDRLCPEKTAPLEIKSLQLTIKNDPLPTLVIEGRGTSDVLGPVHISGTWGRLSGEFFVTLEFTNIPVGSKLIERLALYCPDVGVHAQQLSGAGQVRFDLSFQPKSSRPWSYELHASLARGKFAHPRLPQALEGIEAQARCVDGQITVESAVARSGATQWKLTHLSLTPGPEGDLNGHIEVEHLPASGEVFQALPEKLQRLRQDFSPQGCFAISADFARNAGQWREHAVIRPEGITAAYEKFAYALDQISGKLDQEFDPVRSINRVKVDLVGRSGRQPVYIEGFVELRPLAIDLKIRGKDVPIDAKLRSSLPAEYQALVNNFSPTGLADFDLWIHRQRDAAKADNHYVAFLHDVSLRHAVFPYLLENAAGTLEIHGEQWECRDFHATHKGGDFRARGASVHAPDGKHMNIGIWGENVLLDEEMEAALMQPGLRDTWRKLAPKGRINFSATVNQVAQQAPDIAVSVGLRGCEIFPEFFPYLLTDLQGQVHYANRQLQFHNLTARHGQTRLKLQEGNVYLNPAGELLLSLVNVGGLPVIPDAELLRALPKPLGDTCARLQLRDPLSLMAKYLRIRIPGDGTPPHIAWDGGVRFRDAAFNVGANLEHVTGQVFCRGEHHGTFGNVNGNMELTEATIFRQTFADVVAGFNIVPEQPSRLLLPRIAGRLYGGNIGGEVFIDFGKNPQYELNLFASQLQLIELGRMNHLGREASLQGMAEARLYLRGQGFAQSGIEGAGSIDVPNGKMYNLPPLLDLLKVLNLRLPDKTLFEEAHIQFGIRGRKVSVNELSLLGNAVSLNGQGTMNLDGTELNLDFYSIMGRTWPLPPGLDKIPPLISKQLLKIKVRGSFDRREVTKEPVPMLVEPIKRLLRYMNGKNG